MSGEKETVVNGGFGPCQDMYDRFLNCMTFGGQLRHMRREGSAENCGDLITDYSRCLMAQASHNEVRKKELFQSSNIYLLRENHPENDILVRKERPSWD